MEKIVIDTLISQGNIGDKKRKESLYESYSVPCISHTCCEIMIYSYFKTVF